MEEMPIELARALALWLASKGREGHTPESVIESAKKYEQYILGK